jgi:hypothetical protein
VLLLLLRLLRLLLGAAPVPRAIMDHLNLEHEAKLARSPPRSMASTPGRSRRSVFGESFHSWDSEHSCVLEHLY